MPKNIVILFDGTSNEISEDRTNVLRLYGTLEKSEDQLVWYDPGVGTLAADNSWVRWWPRVVEFWGMMTGWGLDENVKEAYRFLAENWETGDRIYLFGFSRGAYSATVLAGFIHAIGILETRNFNLLDYAYRAYRSVGAERETKLDEIELYDRVLRTEHPPIRLLGLFDTVASVIEHGGYRIRLRSHAFTNANPSVESVRHAVAIDELRVMFRAQLWPEAENQDVREVWFAGVHGDVGGGYPEAESGLAKVPLAWMIGETADMGLVYSEEVVRRLVCGEGAMKYEEPNPLGKRHQSMNWFWAIFEFLPRLCAPGSHGRRFLGLAPPAFFSGRKIAEGARVHRSVIIRRDRLGETHKNLPEEFIVEG
ncbi:DUF2235 domain-containing protein [Afifella sp. JA880]|uniref:DUF2235 domain-containing protein n=1 Tax=Afifella sp. JA880 TaxID=2975280 RepID=UPI0021BB5E42|nr:DUF2235 domain-containing protein [Afifella sp. JA880]MCT8267781.1 DUF2235 domain-containing protein [Afifella sp. JA880]